MERRGLMKTRHFLWRKWGADERFEKRENDGLSLVFYLESAELRGTVMRILDRGMRPTRSLQEPTIFSDKICSLEAQKGLSHLLV